MHFGRRVAEPRSAGLIGHVSAFGLAPQPLLILLGSLLIDIDAADVYQRRREPATWRWAEGETGGETFIVREPADLSGPPALVLSLSATIAHERILSLNPDYSIWDVTIAAPHNDFLQHRETLQAFRQELRTLLDRITNRCISKLTC